MNLQELLDEHGVDSRHHGSHHHTSAGWVNIDCFLCTPNSNKFRLGINLTTNRASCWICGPVALWKVLGHITGLSTAECLKLHNRFHPVEVVKRSGKLKEPEGVGPLHDFHRSYLLSRGFKPSLIEGLWGVQGIGQHGGHLRWRLYIPIYSRGRVVCWTTRGIADHQTPRYISALTEDSEVPIGDCLYGVDYCSNSVVVVEGPIDVWAIGRGAVAICGMNLSPTKLQQLSRFPVRYVCFDNQPEAQVRARKLCNDLSVFAGKTTNLVLETGKDAASASKLEIQSIRERLK